MNIFCDGSGFNGMVSKFGIITDEGKSSTMVFNESLSNNVMEYSAIIMACVVARPRDVILSDSQLAVKQINGEWKVKDGDLFALRQAAAALVQGKGLILKWIPREQNRADKVV